MFTTIGSSCDVYCMRLLSLEHLSANLSYSVLTPYWYIRLILISVSFFNVPSTIVHLEHLIYYTDSGILKTFNYFSKMKSVYGILSFVASTNALIAQRWASCCFHVSASGAVTGTIGQLNDGQNRQGGGLSPAEYCIADGAITDANGRGCILTRKSYYTALTYLIALTQLQLPLHNGNVTLGQPRQAVFPLTVMGPLRTTATPPSGSARLVMMAKPIFTRRPVVPTAEL